jgi:hypothetical protein
MVPVVDVHLAKFTITYQGQQGDLPDFVSFDASDEDLKQMALESVRQGYIPGIDAAPDADFTDFRVDRYPARPDVPYNRISLRPKTPFGVAEQLPVEGGDHLVVVRSWVQQHAINGSSVRWGSEEMLQGLSVSIGDMERLAQRIREAVLKESGGVKP